MIDQQAAMERLQDLYREKNEHLEKFLEPVTPFEFYREIFPVGSFERKGHFEDAKGNGIAVTVPKAAGIALEIQEEGKAKRYTITDELSELSEVYNTNFTIMSPLSYFGRRRCGKNARYLFALVFDLDGVGMPPAPGYPPPDEQRNYSQSNLCCKQRDGASPVLCAAGPGPYVPTQPEMLEGIEVFPNPPDMEQVHLHD